MTRKERLSESLRDTHLMNLLLTRAIELSVWSWVGGMNFLAERRVRVSRNSGCGLVGGASPGYVPQMEGLHVTWILSRNHVTTIAFIRPTSEVGHCQWLEP